LEFGVCDLMLHKGKGNGRVLAISPLTWFPFLRATAVPAGTAESAY